MSISFVLVEPTRAANVGAAARAIKTMGFEQLILVNSALHLESEAQWLAHGAQDILANTIMVNSLNDVREQTDLLVATTARERGSPRRYLSPTELVSTLQSKQILRPIDIQPHSNSHPSQNRAHSCAIIFGRESSGLNNDELSLCDLYSYVSLAAEYPSLNLAQAVMVFAYQLSQINTKIGLQQALATDTATDQLQALKAKAMALVEQIDAGDDSKLVQWLSDGIAMMGKRDMKMAHQLLNNIAKKLK
ncbi:tRNA/rRNA methyltransferase [Shewanella livingstonensis]|uniref:tRNA/rRNA methyltransferase n=1 Tax=Shewanella livingstonensis TaxID=150120 RepID=A0A3G8LXF6_9GAMM|nr:tRNA/rRNA methyltransferase [Shewanella livingstonensis]AZG73410.1 tRNA/rRNA methyltransferase [Shewanella livingstonensis]